MIMSSHTNYSNLLPSVTCNINFTQPEIDPLQLKIFDVCLWTSTVTAWTLGPLLMFGIIHYEKFGGDPQKRSLGNRLISSAVKTLAAFAFCWQILLLLNRYDLANLFVYITLTRCYMGLALASIGFVETSVALRYFQVFVWEHIKEINEDLAMRSIGISILAISGALGYSLNMNLAMYKNLLVFSKGNFSQLEVPKHICQPDNIDPWSNR